MGSERTPLDIPPGRIETLGPLPREFYRRDTLIVARELVGKRLVRSLGAHRLAGRIVETEAYLGSQDQASHAFHRTPRSSIMYGPPGYAYVYFIYGMYHCLNTVTEDENTPGAVLIRGILPDEGLEQMLSMRGGHDGSRASKLADGPGKLCRALHITRELNGADLTQGSPLHLEFDTDVPEDEIIITPRVGVRGDMDSVRRPWRFLWRNPQSR